MKVFFRLAAKTDDEIATDGRLRQDLLDTLDSLVSKSLITVREDESGMRYGMLETIRAFGAERLEKSVIVSLPIPRA